MAKQNRDGFTLVELLVVITIIGILIGLLLPAVNSMVEKGRRTQCSSNLHNIALAVKAHAAQHDGQYPTGGWGQGYAGSSWAGDPDRGFGRRQPGGWCYNILPYMGETSLHTLGEGENETKAASEHARAAEVSLKAYICPTRRGARPCPYTRSGGYKNASVANGSPVGKVDYAMCAGIRYPGTSALYEPSDLSDANDTDKWSTLHRDSRSGVSYYRSEIKDSHISDGESNQYMVGEKYVNPAHYETGRANSDNESWNTGFSYDIYKWVQAAPTQDKMNESHNSRFGGPHPAGWQVAFCDGSVRLISWNISSGAPDYVHQRLGQRNDGEPVGGNAF